MRAPDQHWAALVALLPPGTDQAWFGKEFARIQSLGPAGLEQQRSHYLEAVRACDDALAKLPHTLLDLGGIAAHRFACQTHADFIAQHRRGKKVWRYIELMVLAKRAGVSLSYTSESTQAEPKPHGDGITYLLAAAAVLGTPLSAHRALGLLKAYGKLQPAAATLRGTSMLRADTVVLDASGQIVERNTTALKA
jgi:hypothetical protein